MFQAFNQLAEREEPELKSATHSILSYYAVTEFFCNKSATVIFEPPKAPLRVL
jgi:hypothetical protein